MGSNEFKIGFGTTGIEFFNWLKGLKLFEMTASEKKADACLDACYARIHLIISNHYN